MLSQILSQKHAAPLQTFHQADIRMPSHPLLRLDDDNKLSTGLIQVDCQDFLSTSLMQVVSTTSSKSANIKVASNLVLPDTWCIFTGAF